MNAPHELNANDVSIYESDQMPSSAPMSEIQTRTLDDLNEGRRFMKGLLFGLLFSLPFWAIILSITIS